MKSENTIFRNMGYKILLFLISLIFAFITFISAVSIYTGITNADRAGFWVPLVLGIIAILFSIRVCILLFKITLNKMREKDIISHI